MYFISTVGKMTAIAGDGEDPRPYLASNVTDPEHHPNV